MARSLIGHSEEAIAILTDKEYAAARAGQDSAITQSWAIPMFVATVCSLWLAWLLARFGARYRVVKFAVFPVVHFIACFLCGVPAFIICMIVGRADTAADISLFSSVWLPLVSVFWSFLPGIHMMAPEAIPKDAILGTIAYQLIAYLLFTRWIVRNVTLAIVDAANVKIAMAKGIDINQYRIEKAKTDDGYLSHAMYYESRGVQPPWSIISVGFAGGFDCVDYYFGDV